MSFHHFKISTPTHKMPHAKSLEGSLDIFQQPMHKVGLAPDSVSSRGVQNCCADHDLLDLLSNLEFVKPCLKMKSLQEDFDVSF